MTRHLNPGRLEQIVLRAPSPGVALTSFAGVGIADSGRARTQHDALREALARAGAEVKILPADPAFPDGGFIGDLAVVAPRLAVIANFAENHPRQGEQKAAASALAAGRFLKFITAPGLLDASDVLYTPETVFIAVTPRTNAEGASQLAYFLREFGHDAVVFSMNGDVRLRDAAVLLEDQTLILRPEIADLPAFLDYRRIVLRPAERTAGGALMVEGTLVLPHGLPELTSELRLMGQAFSEVNVSEFEKMGGALSSLALCLPSREAASQPVRDLSFKKAA